MGWEREAASRQKELWYRRGLAEAPGHRFYRRLNEVRDQPGFDECCEAGCQMLYHKKLGQPSLAPRICFRVMLIVFDECQGLLTLYARSPAQNGALILFL